ncbi:MAG: helix-turn-helix domain-containing protein [Alphaproteobacteria bacterium]
MNFNEYAEKAIVRYGLTGYNNLARELGMTKSSISMLRSGKNVPSEETMIKLAELAGLPKEEALIDLNLWRSKNDPKRHEIWLRISKMVGCLLLLIICLLPSFSYAANHNIYIMRQIFIM